MSDSVEEKIRQHFSLYPQREYPKGQILIFADEQPEYIFYIVSGKVIKYDVSYRGDEVIINVFKPPAFFPMSWALNQAPDPYFYKTDSPTTLHVIPVGDALTFLRANPDVVFDLLSRVYRGIDGLLGRLVRLMSGSARSRLLYELLIECRRFGQPQTDGGRLLSINELDIASRAGLSRETVNREMRKIKTSGLVERYKGNIIVKNVDALEAAVRDEP